jgi:hypothetical protein
MILRGQELASECRLCHHPADDAEIFKVGLTDVAK